MITAPRFATLRAYLASTGVSQRALAKTVNVNQSTISMLVTGRRAAGGALARLLHAVTGVPLEGLLAPTRSYRGRRRKRKRAPPRDGMMAPLTQH